MCHGMREARRPPTASPPHSRIFSFRLNLPSPQARCTQPQGGRATALHYLKTQDTDGDGKISRAEFDKFIDALRTHPKYSTPLYRWHSHSHSLSCRTVDTARKMSSKTRKSSPRCVRRATHHQGAAGGSATASSALIGNSSTPIPTDTHGTRPGPAPPQGRRHPSAGRLRGSVPGRGRTASRG